MIDPKEITVDSVEGAVKSLYAFGQRPRADSIQRVLDKIEICPDEKLRCVCFAVVKANVSRSYHDLVVASRIRSAAAWQQIIQPK